MSDLVIIGAGPIGVASARAAIADGVVDRVAAVVDPDPDARAAVEAEFGAQAFEHSSQLPEAAPGDRAVVAFSSSAAKVAPEIVRVVGAGYHAVTTCEELAWPARHIWEAMHTAARSDAKNIIVAGANPGFVMDRFPLVLAGAARRVRSVRVWRRVDTSTRRGPLVDKTGRGLSRKEFEAGIASGELGHKGLSASAHLLAHALGWSHPEVDESVEPVMGDDGLVAGVHHRALVRGDGGREIELDLTMVWQLPDPGDRVVVDGIPALDVRIEGGYHGDEGTIAQVTLALHRCGSLPPGFYRPTDLPLRLR